MNSEDNPSRQEQEHQARQSPLKQPETETSHAKPADVDAAAQSHQHGPRPSKDASGTHRDNGEEGGGPRGNDATSGNGEAADRAEGARAEAGSKRASYPEDVSPRGVDVDNDYSSDSTLDTDGKDRDTKGMGSMDDSEVVSNASTANAVPTSPEATIAGIDSRVGKNKLGVLLADGSTMVDEGFGVDDLLPGDNGDDPTMTGRRREHQAANHTRPAHLIRIEKTEGKD